MSHRSAGWVLSTRRFPIICVMVLAALFAWNSAADATSPSPSDGAKTTLHIGWMQEPDNLNPFTGVQVSDYVLFHLNYDYLVGFDAKALEPRPEIASAWQVSADGRTWTFTIRSGLKWQDGQPLTANDVAFTFNFIVHNRMYNYTAYTDGITKAVAVDDTTVKIYTRTPKANMLHMAVPIIPEHIWSKIGAKTAQSAYENRPAIVGSGPFQIVEWKRGEFIRLKANKDYWGGAPKVDEIVFQLYTNASTMTADLRLGTIDGAINVPAAEFKQLGAVPGLTANKGTSWRFNELAMNCYESPNSLGNPVLRDEKFRQAINWAIDREKVVSVALGGYGTVGTTTLVPYSKYHWEPPADATFTYNPAKANQILDAAGYKDVDGDGYRETKKGKKLSLRLYATTDVVENQTAGKLVVGWLQDVSIRLEYEVLDPSVLIDAEYNYKDGTYAPDWDIFIWYWVQDVFPQTMLASYTPQQIEGWNDCMWTSPDYTRLNAKQSRTLDETAYTSTAAQMQQMFYQASPYAILAYPFLLEAYNTEDWQGWVRVPSEATGAQQGAVLYTFSNIDTYRFVEPRPTTGAGGGASTATLPIVLAIALVTAVLIVLVLVRRRSHRAITE